MSRLTTATDVIDALGGTQAVARLLNVGASAVSNYRRLGFPARAYYKLSLACAQKRLDVAEAVFGGLQSLETAQPLRPPSRQLRTGTQEADGMLAQFIESGYEPVTLSILQPSSPFIDRMGPEMQRRLFTFTDPAGEPLCLRPDLTIPTALEHLRRGIGGANRYCYQGTAFRYQPRGSGKPEEFTQLGIEIIGETMSDTHQKDANEAEVFEQILKIIIAAGVSRFEIVFNDSSHLADNVNEYDFSEAFKSQLKRRLLQSDSLDDIQQTLTTRAQNEAPPPNPLRMNFEETDNIIGRSGAEIMARLERKQQESQNNANDLKELNRMRVDLEKQSEGKADLPDFARPLIQQAIAVGCHEDQLVYAPNLGQKMAYYTGLFFEIHVPALQEKRVIASGGRYDDLLFSLGASQPVPAIGGAIALERLQEAM
ncbi:ABC transporter membrane spanning protein [Candidatus Micropelagos thuwalensis]|uniref:Histidine--tRNA ligase n=1 Tax=Candidatus Micropelagius thuwalensis TaxID=1397666 RepID=U2WS59_9PROT|nr:ATP phosphoribosyltransferase regulatory subunit [Candidatus Micropelagos thuwalensis]ERL46373.1 ABC transporter membrane spanning protein [Candidatus Micropelagos thuwalensis]